MPRLYLIRHAKPAATWSEASDPGLDSTGQAQAEAAAAKLAAQLSGPLPVHTSPLLRCRETAAPLERLWQRRAALMPAVAEIPAPPLALEQRHVWLQQAMAGTWAQLHLRRQPDWPDYLAWRTALLEQITTLSDDCVIFSHFIAINVIIGAALRNDQVICCRPDHASITVIESTGGELHSVQLGQQAETLVLARS